MSGSNGSSASSISGTVTAFPVDLASPGESVNEMAAKRLAYLTKLVERTHTSTERSLGRIQADLSGVKEGFAGLDVRTSILEERLPGVRIEGHSNIMDAINVETIRNRIEIDKLTATQEKATKRREGLTKWIAGTLLAGLGALLNMLKDKVPWP